MAGLITRNDFPLFMQPDRLGLLKKNAWDAQEKLLGEMRGDYFKIAGTDKSFIASHSMVGIENARRMREGRAPTLTAPAMGRPTAMVFPTWGIAVAISREAQEDDADNVLVPFCAKELRIAASLAQEEDAVSQYNDGFTAQGWENDGKAIFAVDHPLIKPSPSGATVYGNRHPTDAALSMTALDTARIASYQMVNDSGRFTKKIIYKYLDVAPALEPYANQLMRTPRSLGNNYNDPNIHQGSLIVRVNPRFTTSTMWSLQSDDHDWRWYDRVKPQFITEVDKISGITILFVRFRHGRGAFDARGKWASRGA